jgi:hypothetical protein
MQLFAKPAVLVSLLFYIILVVIYLVKMQFLLPLELLGNWSSMVPEVTAAPLSSGNESSTELPHSKSLLSTTKTIPPPDTDIEKTENYVLPEQQVEETIPFWNKGNFTSSLSLKSSFYTATLDLQKTDFILKLAYEVWLTDSIQFHFAGRAKAKTTNRIEPYSDHIDAELREFFWDGYMGKLYYKIGKQQIVWGQADGIKILDVVNPQDFHEFILPEFIESRLPLWSLNFEIPLDKTSIQFVWLPELTYHDIPESDADFAFTSPLLIPVVPSGVEKHIEPAEKPKKIMKDSDFGIRISTFWNGWDLAVMYLYHYWDAPVLYQSLELADGSLIAVVSPKYKRNHMIGTSLSNSFSDFTLRSEWAFFSDSYNLRDFTPVSKGIHKSGEFNYLLGIDYLGISDLFLSLQFSQSIITNYISNLNRNRNENYLTILARHHFLNETLHAEISGIYNLNREDGVVRPKISYNFQDSVLVWIGADIFWGDSSGLFGQYEQNSRYDLGVTYIW